MVHNWARETARLSAQMMVHTKARMISLVRKILLEGLSSVHRMALLKWVQTILYFVDLMETSQMESLMEAAEVKVPTKALSR